MYKEIVALSELKHSVLCITFHCFHNGQTVAPFFSFLSQHALVWTVDNLFYSSLVNELFMS